MSKDDRIILGSVIGTIIVIIVIAIFPYDNPSKVTDTAVIKL